MSIFNPLEALEHCEREVTKADIGVSLHGKFIPEELRLYYYTVHNFRLELFKTRELMTNTTLQSSKQEWWLQNIDDIWELRPPREPLSIALGELRKFSTVRKSHFERMISGRLQDPVMQTWAHFDRFIDNNYTMSVYILLELFCLYGEAEFKAATFVGRAWGISQFLLLTQYYSDRGRFYFPQELLAKHNLPMSVSIDDTENKNDQIQEQFFDVILDVAAYGKMNMEKAREMAPGLPKYSNLAFLPLIQSEYYYNNLEKHNFDVFNVKTRRIPWARVFFNMIKHVRKGTF